MLEFLNTYGKMYMSITDLEINELILNGFNPFKYCS